MSSKQQTIIVSGKHGRSATVGYTLAPNGLVSNVSSDNSRVTKDAATSYLVKQGVFKVTDNGQLFQSTQNNGNQRSAMRR